MPTVCTNCIEDPCLRLIVTEGGEVQICSVCENDQSPTFTAEQLGQTLEPILRNRLGLGEDIRVFSGPDDEKGGYEQAGDPIEYFVAEFLGQDFDFLDEIVCAVMEAENVWPPDGEEAFFEDYYNYVPIRVSPHKLLADWHAVHQELYNSRRFFSSSAKSLFSFLFRDIEALRASTSNGIEGVVNELPAETTIFRARSCSTRSTLQHVFEDPMTHAGPPPADQARAGRMNAEGVVVLYGAMDSDTAVAELRPPLGGDTIVIRLITNQKLRLLDFERLESAYSSISHFDPGYDGKFEKHSFLRQLHSLISQPVVPGKETEYLITQTMSEYLAHVHQEPFHGILFSSVQQQGGTNIVIFPNASGLFPVEYLEDSLKVFYTRAIIHDNLERYVYEQNGKVYMDSDFETEE